MNKKITDFGVGASSIIMIFVVLCLTTFSLLSFSSAKSSLRLANKSKEYYTAFGDAELKANQTLSKIDDKLAKAQTSFDYGSEVSGLSSIDGVKVKFNGNNYNISYSVPVLKDTYLNIELNVPANPSAYRYNIIKWNTSSTEKDFDNGDKIWDGTF